MEGQSTVRVPRGAGRHQAAQVQWGAMPDGNDGIHGNGGNVVSVTYRF